VVIADDSSDTLRVLSELSGNAVNLVGRGWAGVSRDRARDSRLKRGERWVVGALANAGRL